MNDAVALEKLLTSSFYRYIVSILRKLFLSTRIRNYGNVLGLYQGFRPTGVTRYRCKHRMRRN